MMATPEEVENADNSLTIPNKIMKNGYTQVCWCVQQGTSEFPDYAFQEGDTDSGGPIRIQEGQYGTVYA